MDQRHYIYTKPHPFALQYLGLRTAVGIIGVALPWVLILGNQWLFGSQFIESSISAYYYTAMRDVFVGALCAIAIFMASYRGIDWIDDWAGNLACVFALGAAWFPTTADELTTAPKWTVSSFWARPTRLRREEPARKRRGTSFTSCAESSSSRASLSV